MSGNLSNLINECKTGKITGNDLAKLVQDGKLSKSDRRKITKSAKKPELTPRQLLRQEIKTKKQMPRLSKDDRHRKYVTDRNDSLREKEQSKNMVCLGCRQTGHMLKYCTEINNLKKLFCFNCGENDHALRACTKPQTPGHLPFADCFICKQKGHISKDCTNNINGLYPNGGCCHICLKKDHLVKNCPLKEVEEKEDDKFSKKEIVLSVTVDVSRHRDDYIEETSYNHVEAEEQEDDQPKKKKKKKHAM